MKVPFYYQEVIPRMNRRTDWHDYHSKSIYLITIRKSAIWPALAAITADAHVKVSNLGECIIKNLDALCNRYPMLTIINRVIMPDHIHFILYVRERTKQALGSFIASFKSACSKDCWELFGIAKESDKRTPLFEEGFNDSILYGANQLQKMIDYVDENPRRLAIKRANPDLFQRNITLTINNEEYHALGNIYLLKNRLINFVKVSRQHSREKLKELDAEWRFTMAENGVLVSPFISPKEKVYRDMAIDAGANLIIVLPNGFSEYYKPGGRYFNLCASGRLLLIAPKEYNNRREPMKRDKALALNDTAEKIAAGEFSLGRMRL